MEAPPPTAEVKVAAVDFEITVPPTPPQRREKIIVGVAVVPYAPKALKRKHRPSCR